MASFSSVSSCSKIESVKSWLESYDVCDFEQDDRSIAISSPLQDSWNEDRSLSEHNSMSTSKYRQKSNSNNNNQAGQEKGKKNSQDKYHIKNPFYVPRKPHFFEHDLRNWDEDEEGEGHKKRSTRKKYDCGDSWAHDLYDPELQKPKSEQEIIQCYGYDIRSENRNERNAQSKRNNSKQKKMDCRQENSTLDQEFHQEHIPERSIDTTRKTISQKNCTKILPLKPSHEYHSDLKVEQKVINQPRSDNRNDKRFNNKSLSNLKNKLSNAPDLEVVSTHERKKVDKSVIPPIKATNNIKNKPSNNYNPRFSGNHDKPNLASLSRVGMNLPRESSVIRDATEIARQSTEQGRKDTFNKALSSKNLTPKKNFSSIKRQSIISSIPKVANSSKTVRNTVQSCDRRESSASKKDKCPVKLTDSSLNGDYHVLDPLARVMGYGYFNTAHGRDENKDFIFPKPPDVSADHLSPFIPQHHYFFTNNHHPHMYYQQGYEHLPMQWGYYTHSNCYQGNSSGIAILNQHCAGNWTDPSQVNQLVVSSQHVDTNPYYSAPEEVDTTNETSEVEYITSSFTRLSTSSIPQTTHRYSLLRSKFILNQLNK